MVDPEFQRCLDAITRAYNAGDIATYVSHLHPSVSFRGPLSGEQLVGREQVRRIIQMARDLLRLRSLSLAPGYQCQDVVATDWRGTAETPEGDTLNLAGILVVTFTPEHLIRDMQFFWDPRPLLGHLEDGR
jgi:hypothetical protein